MKNPSPNMRMPSRAARPGLRSGIAGGDIQETTMTARDAIGRDVELDDFYAPLTHVPPDRPAYWRKSVSKRLRTGATAALLAGAMIQAAGSLPVLAQGVQLVVVDVKAVAKGYRASKLMG